MMFELEPNEKIVLKVRKHWFIFLFHGLFIVILAIAPPGLIKISYQLFAKVLGVETISSLSSLFSFIYFLWLLALWIALFIKWTDYYLDIWYVTPKRIIDVEQKGLFRREVIELRLEKIQDTTVEVKGLIPTFLNFGDIHVQTAGAGREIILRDAHNPSEAKKTILFLNNKVLEIRVKDDSL